MDVIILFLYFVIVVKVFTFALILFVIQLRLGFILRFTPLACESRGFFFVYSAVMSCSAESQLQWQVLYTILFLPLLVLSEGISLF